MPKTARQPSKPKAHAPPAKAGKRKPYGFRTVELGVVPEVQDAAQALAVGAKEAWNVCAHLIRHVHMAYERDKASKTHVRIDMSERDEGKRLACEAALNEERAAKIEDGDKAAKPLPRLGPSVDGLDSLLTDSTFMERFAKARPDEMRNDKLPAFSRLPFLIARDAVATACDALKGRRQAMISWTPGDAVPKLPGYRREAASFAFDWFARPKLAAEIVREARKANAAFIVLGRNSGWKSGSNMEAEQNRRLHSFPHSLAWKLVYEKAWVQGIATVETEESNTRRNSFVHGDLMAVRPAQAAKAAKKRAKAFTGNACRQVEVQGPEGLPAEPGECRGGAGIGSPSRGRRL